MENAETIEGEAYETPQEDIAPEETPDYEEIIRRLQTKVLVLSKEAGDLRNELLDTRIAYGVYKLNQE